MHEFTSFNRRIIFSEKTFLPAASYAAFYGKGVFATVAVRRAKPFLWEKHWQKLKIDAEKTGVNLSDFTEKDVKNCLLALIQKNGFQTGRARLTFFDAGSGGFWNFQSKDETSLLITTANRRIIKKSFGLTVSSFRLNSLSPLAGVKSCNYLERLLILSDAKAEGFDEAVCRNERGEVVSASTANIFWVKNKQIFTPSLQTGCRAGTTREFIMENFAVGEKEIYIDELNEAEEVFITSSGIGAVSVKNINYKCYQSHIITDSLRKFLKFAGG